MLRRILILSLMCFLAGVCAYAADPPPAPAPAPPPPTAPNPQDIQQVNVSVKVVEFQTSKGVETGLSAYFLHRKQTPSFGRVTSTGGEIVSSDVTFPTSTIAGITVFLDQLHMGEGDMEVVLQGLVDQNRAFILSQPRAMVSVGSPVPTVIQTTQKIPYENTVVVGATAVQTTAFRDTGVSLTVSAPEIVDDDGDLGTTNDTFIKLLVSAQVNEEGERIVVALDDQMAAGGIFGQASNAIRVPEFVSRSVATSVWVRHGQVLLLGGLYRNTENKNLATLPWLTQGEDAVVGLAERVIPGNFLPSPLSASVGNRSTNEARRELVFLIKAEVWRASYTVAAGLTPAGMDQPPKKKVSISNVIQGISGGLSGGAHSDSVGSSLGGSQ